MKKILLLALLLGATAWSADAKKPDGEVKNVIYLIGDGMGLAHMSLLEIEGGYEPTAFNRATNVALVSTRSANNRVTDSAAAGTALATGEKTDNSMVGQRPDGSRLESMVARATADGRPTGLVVTCYLQHATPAAFYAHVPQRYQNEAITRDMLASDVDVLIGGGRKWLSGACEAGGSYLEAMAHKGYAVVPTLDAAAAVHSGRLLAAVAEEHLPKAADRGDYLPRAAAKALELLSAESAARKKGFVLMIEGSQIDMAAHAKDAQWLLDEMRDFDRTIHVAMDFADRNPGTLVVVVADHETGGVSMPSGKSDFTASESGVRYNFGTGSHTGIRVPVYFYGAGAERMNGLMENSDLSNGIMKLLGLK